MYKAGDLVYIPSEDTLTQPISGDACLTVNRFIRTEKPTNALIVSQENGSSQYKVYVGGEQWYVSQCHVYPTVAHGESNDSLR